MTTNETDLRLSRREAVGAAAAAGLTAALLKGGHAGAIPPEDPEPEPGPTSADWREVADVGPAIPKAPTSPGVSYVSLAGISFFLVDLVGGKSSSNGEMNSSANTFAAPPIFLPHRARITELVTYFVRPNSASTRIRLVQHRSHVGSASGVWNQVAWQSTSTKPVLPGIQTYVTPVAPGTNGAVVDTSDAAYFVIVNPPADAAHQLWGVRVGYVAPGAGVYYPIDPIRVFDSRLPAYPASGRFLPNTSRVVPVKDAHDAAGGITVMNAVPVGATAVTCNLTVTATSGPNFLSLTPGDATGYTTSAVNWSGSNVSIANGLTSKIDANRTVKIWCGSQPGSTDAIIDVNGYYFAA